MADELTDNASEGTDSLRIVAVPVTGSAEAERWEGYRNMASDPTYQARWAEGARQTPKEELERRQCQAYAGMQNAWQPHPLRPIEVVEHADKKPWWWPF